VLAGLVFGVGAVTLFVYREFDFYGGTEAGRTSDSDSLSGKTGRVTDRVTSTGGEVKLQDAGFNPYYQARSLDGEIPEGEEVIVVDPGGGNVVTVQSLEADHRDDIDRELARERDDPSERAAADGEGTTDDVDVTADASTGTDPSAGDAEEERDTERESTD